MADLTVWSGSAQTLPSPIPEAGYSVTRFWGFDKFSASQTPRSGSGTPRLYYPPSQRGVGITNLLIADRYERRSVLVTSNLAFSEWGSVFQGDRMTAALLDRLTHRCEIFEMNGESFRFRESMKAKTDKNPKKTKDPKKGN